MMQKCIAILGGWLVVQRRQDGSVDFNRTWAEYEDGFGNLRGGFWYGLRALHCLTGQGGWEMRMDLTLDDNTKVFLHYEQFKVASASEKYKLSVGGLQRTTIDPMAIHNKMYFTTKDSDNDIWYSNCAIDRYGANNPAGGWWYSNYHHVNPNRQYNLRNGVIYGNRWNTIAFSEIKIRSLNCNI